MAEHIHALLSKWTTAERAGDAEALATLLTDDFCGVGPLGFILPRPAWLDRHRQGLTYEQFSLQEIQIRIYDKVAIVTARNNARGTYQGQPLPEALRVTVVLASNLEVVRLATVHMSFIAGTQGSPPMPGPIDSTESSAATNAEEKER
jgi:ketosteroid isomerase-like protein